MKNAPSGGNREARISTRAPIRMVNRLMTRVMVTRPTFWLKEVSGGQPKQPEMALENPSTARDPCSSSMRISRPRAPVHTAVVAPVVSAAETRKTTAMVKNAPQIKDRRMLRQKYQTGKAEKAGLPHRLPDAGNVH